MKTALPVASLALVALFVGTEPVLADKGPGSADGTKQEFRQLERDIPSLYLINALCLSKEQAGQMVGVLERVKNIEDSHCQKCEKIANRSERDFDKEVAGIVSLPRKEVLAVEPRIRAPSRRARLMKARGELGELRRERDVEIARLADQTREILTESQRGIVGRFLPCFIPADDFRNPERVGQAADNTSFTESVLSALRHVESEEKVAQATERALEQLVPYAMHKRHISYTEEAEDKVRSELSASLRYALNSMRNMGDADFELEKSKLAARVLPIKTDDPDNPDAIRWKISMYVLNDSLLDVMKARAAGAAPSAAPAATPRAVSCDLLDCARAFRTAAVLHGLELTGGQATEILTIARDALSAREKVEARIAEEMKNGVSSYYDLRSQLASGQQTRKGEGAANRSHYKVKVLCDDVMFDTLRSYEAKMDQILSANQVASLTDSSRSERRNEFIRKSQAEPAAQRAGRILTDVRGMSAIEFDKDKKKMCGEFAARYAGECDADKDAIDVSAETERLVAVLEKARKMSSSQYSEARKDLAMEFCPRRAKPRPLTYGTRYAGTKPLPELYRTTMLVFSDAGCDVLEKIAAR